ncbi:MAG: hypothetical protein AB3A66_27335 (plasmid) [Nodularia sp. CChRGM 3473]
MTFLLIPSPGRPFTPEHRSASEKLHGLNNLIAEYKLHFPRSQ